MTSFDNNGSQLPSRGGFHLDKGRAKFMGVCSGLADYFNVDVTMVRIGVVVATLLGAGILIPVYLAVGLIAN